MKLCEKCREKPTWSQHQHCRLCIDCSGASAESSLRKREKTRARQRRGPPVAFDVKPWRTQREARKHPPVTVPLPLLAIRGDVMTRSEVAAVLGMTDWGVALLEKRALERFREAWQALYG
jgi:hypothetical protein